MNLGTTVDVVMLLFVSGCCFVTFYTRKAALQAQDALHNVKTLMGVSIKLSVIQEFSVSAKQTSSINLFQRFACNIQAHVGVHCLTIQ